MVNIVSQKMQNVALSDCRSVGSSQHPSGRFPKVSIGITIDKCPKTGVTGPGLRKEDTAALPAGGTTVSCQAAEEITRQGIIQSLERNRSHDVEDNKASAWLSTRSVRVETPTAETVKFFVNRASVLQSEDGLQKKFDTVAYGKRREKGGNVERVEEVAFATMQETHLVNKGNARAEPEKTANFNEKRNLTYEKRREKSGDVEWIEEVALSTKQLAGEENGKQPERMAKCNSEALKVKLWEILGTAPSETKHTLNSPDVMEFKESLNIHQNRENQKARVARTKLISPDPEENKENSNMNQSMEYNKRKATRAKPNMRELEENKQDLNTKQSKQFQKRKAAKAKQNSDTIETDSESPDQVMRRPVTRSLTRKKAPPKRVQKFQGNASYVKKPMSSPSSDFKLKLGNKNIFTFDEVEGKAGSLGHTSSAQSNRSKEKINEQNEAKIEPRRIHFAGSISEKSLHNCDKVRTSFSLDKASSTSKEKGNSSLSRQDKKQSLRTVDRTPNDIHHSQRAEQLNFGSPLWAYNKETCENTDSPVLKMKRHSWGCENSPLKPKNAFVNGDVSDRSVGRETRQLDDFHSPTLAMNGSPSPVPATSSKSIHKNCSSKDLDQSTPGFCQSDADTESSDDTRETRKPEDMESPYMEDEVPEKKQFSLSPMEGQDTESEADDLTSQGFGLTEKWFPSTGNPEKSPVSEKSPISLQHTKRARSLKNVTLSRANLSSLSPIEPSRTEETFIPHEALEEYPKGSLARCFAQLKLVLQRFKARMRSQISKRSSEILSAAADKIRQQLQDVESQILGDVGKFNNIGKSKRKRLESRFQNQQERLKLIHDKFKEEVNQHLLDCRSVLEELEAYNMELKGTADRRKVSHRKLLQQVEEAVEAQINDAETSITAVHKDARKKMIGLKRALKEFMD